jgi:GTPase SAR1 family protein
MTLVDNRVVNLAIADTGSLHEVRDLRPLLYAYTNVFIICYSVSDYSSFVSVLDR